MDSSATESQKDPLTQAAAFWPDRVAVISGEASLTFHAWHERASHVARTLVEQGWRSGDRIGLLARPTESFLVNIFGCLRAGITACLVSPRWPAALVSYAESETRWNGFWSDERLEGVPCRTSTIASESEPHLATVIFSSGSTGRPKAIAHTLHAHLASAVGANANLPLGVDDAWLLSLSPAHVGGLAILFRCLLAGAAVILPRSDATFDETLRSVPPSHISLVPTQLKRLLDRGWQPWPRLRGLLLGGAPIPPALVEQARSMHWPVMTTYGLSEMASQVTATSPDADSDEWMTAGHLLPGRELRISAEGEILVRGNTLFAGWIQQGQLVPGTDAEGWYATRDLGSLDTSGCLRVHGRMDDQFISGGENIHPEAIEQTLMNLPAILQAIVVPVEHPEFGHRPVAFIDANVWEEAQWRAHLAAFWPRFMVPDRFFPMPEDVSDKPSRSQLQRRAAELLAQVD